MKTPPALAIAPAADIGSPTRVRCGTGPRGDSGLPDRPGEAVTEHLGARIRDLRKRRGLTLNALSELSQVSRAFLSAVERSEKSPTLPIIVRIARGLDVSMSALLGVEPAATEVAVNRRADQVTFRDPQSGFERTVLSPVRAGGGTEIVLHCIPPGQSSGLLPAHPIVVEKHILVQDGELTAYIDGSVYRASPGDTFSFTITTPYRLCNEGTRPCTYVVVMVDRP